MNLDFTGSLGYAEIEKRFMKFKVRLLGIFKGIDEHTNSNELPQPLLAFLNFLVKEKQFIPDNFITGFELVRLEIN